MARRSRSKRTTESHLPALGALPAHPSVDRTTQLRAIVAMASRLNDSLELTDLLKQALEWAVAVSAHQQGSIMLADHSGRHLLVRAVYGAGPRAVGQRRPHLREQCRRLGAQASPAPLSGGSR